MSERKVSLDQARAEFEDWLTQKRLINLEDVEDDEDASKAKERIEKLISKGKIVIDGGFIIYIPKDNVNGELSEIRFPPRILVEDMSVGDRYKSNETTKRTIAMIAKMTGKNFGIVSKMDGADIAVCGAIIQFYFL